MSYTGSCHCGGIRFEVDGEVDSGLACNCSMCARRASLLWFVPRDKLRLLTSEDAVSTYLFNKHVIRHRFCAKCGIHAFGEAQGPDGRAMAAINLRTLENFDLDSVPVKHYDGRST
ncbi:GFA family protein [Ramlibacter ginsenosidimutans]|uniref:GFA family protein n=1 Tax=Ramlibacter ginsenosidimutans TaxID=502333 RepID=A0A934TWU2_9BURK|nr:GFA family protein [Ramlibacter ginsenosidimutans]MBK6009134.1 GFA family protein [Ramlibacter ginsenosidimutans]